MMSCSPHFLKFQMEVDVDVEVKVVVELYKGDFCSGDFTNDGVESLMFRIQQEVDHHQFHL